MRTFARPTVLATQAAPSRSTLQVRATISSPTIQTNLAISQPGDIYEREAEHAAQQVMCMARPGEPAAEVASQTRPTLEGMRTEAVSDARDERQPGLAPGGASEVAADLTRRLGAGASLDPASRRYFEPRFAHDFGSVRIHNGPHAASAAASIQAHAFTLGRDVVFAAGAYAPSSDSGRRLLAHELAHVVQQSGPNSGRSPSAGLGLRNVPAIVCRAGPAPTPAPTPPATATFAEVGNEAGAAGARSAATSLARLISGAAAVRALETIPITDPEQKKIVIQHVLSSPAVLRAHAEQGKVRALSQQEFEAGQENLGFPGGASAFADAANDFIYITPFGSPSAFTLGHEVSHIQTGPVLAGGADPELALALGNLNTEVRAAYVDYALVQLRTLQAELAAGVTEDKAVAGFAQRYSSAVFDYIAKGHGSVSKSLGELAKVVNARRGTESVPTNYAELKKAIAKGFVTEADLALVFSREVNIFNVEEPFEMEGP
jgi:hypothetical protein